MNPSQCDSCMKSFDRLKINEEHIYDKHFDRTDDDDISLFYSKNVLPLVFDTFKAKLQAGILKGKVQDRSRKSKRLIYQCPLDFAVGTYPVRHRRRGIKHHETCCVRVVCATSKCSNRFCPIGFVPRVVITIFPDGGHSKRFLVENEAYEAEIQSSKLNGERSTIAMKWKSQSEWRSLINVNALDTSWVKLRLN